MKTIFIFNNVTVLSHVSYSPDLAPPDYPFFRFMEQSLCRMKSTNIKHVLKLAVTFLPPSPKLSTIQGSESYEKDKYYIEKNYYIEVFIFQLKTRLNFLLNLLELKIFFLFFQT